MPTIAEQQLQQDMMREAIQRAALARQGQVADAAARAAMYQADKGLEGSKYNADTLLTSTRDTNEARLAGIDMEQSGQTDRANILDRGETERTGMRIRPDMERVNLERDIYKDHRADLSDDPNRIMSKAVANALRQQFGDTAVTPSRLTSSGVSSSSGTPNADADGDSDNSPAAPHGEAGESAHIGGSATPSGQRPARPAKATGRYDMNGFTKDVADIAANVSAARGAANDRGPDDLPAANAFTQGASVRDASGQLRQVAWPAAALPNRQAQVAAVKDAMVREATGKYDTGVVSDARPTAVADGDVPSNKAQHDRMDKLVQGWMAKNGYDPEGDFKRRIAEQATLARIAAISKDPDMSPAEQANALDTVITDGKVPVSPLASARLANSRTQSVMDMPAIKAQMDMLAANVEKLAEPQFSMDRSAANRAKVAVENLLAAVERAGGDTAVARQLINARLKPLTDKRGTTPTIDAGINWISGDGFKTQQDILRGILGVE